MGGAKPSRAGGARAVALVVLLALLLPGAALAHEFHVPATGGDMLSGAASDGPAMRAVPDPCPGGAPIEPDRVITGEFGTELQGDYVMLPLTVPAGTDAMRVKYCHDQPEAPTNAQIKHTLDLGIYEARSGPGDVWDADEFRGWGGSSHPDVTVSPNGFSSEAAYLAAPRLHRHGRTTRGFIPGPMPEGEWAVELGVAAVASRLEGDSEGKVAWRVEIDLIDSPDYSDDPYQPAPYDSTPAKADPGWYAGDLHVHAEHSSLGDATMTETFDYAFGSLEDNRAGLDFITLSDYVTTSAWDEIGRYQPDHPGKLIMRSSEVITYRGHANNHGSLTWADYRTGAIHEREGGGSLTQLRAPRPASTIFDTVQDAGGFTQINHPTIFPSQVPGFAFLCRGCSWDYSDAETDYSKVDAIEIATGPAGTEAIPQQPGPNPFTPLAIQFWEDAIDTGGPNSNKIAAVGSSDSHKAGRYSDLDDMSIPSAPIGRATTVVRAPQLSEQGVEDGVKAGHTYVKLWGNDGPDLRLCAGDLGADEQCSEGVDPEETIMGDTLRADSTEFVARVLNLARASAARQGAYTLTVFKDGAPILTVPLSGDQFELPFSSVGTGRYRLQVMRSAGGIASIEAVSSPIYLEAAGPKCAKKKGKSRGKRRAERCKKRK